MTIKNRVNIVLASASKTRIELLARHGLNIRNQAADINEDHLKNKFCKNMNPEATALFLAKAKAKAVADLYSDAYVIGADQVCVLDNKVFDKPMTHENCINHLSLLRGQTHSQNCAMVIYKASELIYESVSTALLTMRNLSDQEIKAYVNLEKPYSSCGSYMLERHGKHLFSDLKGDHDVILGLPVVKLLNKLYELDLIELSP